jgi:single-strand DNA-binding protein
MALNQVIIMGRITKDLEIKQTPNGAAVLSFTVAVDRYSKTEEKAADFISCVAWNKTAEFIGKYFGKGRMIAITGNLRTRNFEDKNGVERYVTEVFVDKADFTGEPKSENSSSYSGGNAQGYNYTPAGATVAQTSAQTSQQRNPNGYPSPHMYAAPKEQSAPDLSADFGNFEMFNMDGVPF